MPVACRKQIFRWQLVANSEVWGSLKVTKSFHPHQEISRQMPAYFEINDRLELLAMTRH